MPPCTAKGLAVCRILTGISLLYEGMIAFDSHCIRSFLSDDGLWLRVDQIELFNFRPSLLLSHGTDVFAQFFVFIMVGAAFALCMGFYTREASLLTYVCWYSIINRSFVMCHAFDDLTLTLLMWGILGLPWDTIWAIRPHLPRRSCDITQWGLCINVCTLYFLAGWQKTDMCWRDGTAALMAIQIVSIKRPLGDVICASPLASRVVQFAGSTVPWVEILAPFALVSPRVRLRWGVIVTLVLMHVSIGATMRLNAIGVINVAALCSFLPLGPDNRCNHGLLPFTPGAIAATIATASIGHTVFANVMPEIAFMESVAQWSETFHLSQKYNVFAPRPISEDFWLSIVGRDFNDAFLDLSGVLNGDYKARTHTRQFPDAPPKLYMQSIYNDRFAKYIENIVRGWGDTETKEGMQNFLIQQRLRLRLGQYICRRWNARHSNVSALRTLQIIVHTMDHKISNCPPVELRKMRYNIVWNHSCFSEDNAVDGGLFNRSIS